MTANVLRFCIVIMAISAPILIVVLNHHKRHKLGWGDVLTRIGIGAVFIAVAYSTMEGYFTGLGPAPRLYVLFGALVWTNVGLVVSILNDRRCIREEYESALKAQKSRSVAPVVKDGIEQGSS